jgi:hypothetical protein
MARAQANARNASLSTGPRTASGKAASRLNALKHGVLSEEALVRDEDAGALSELRERLHEALAPSGHLETLLVDRIVVLEWRLRRVIRMEAGVLAWYQGGVLVERARAGVRKYERTALTDLEKMLEPTITNDEAHRAADASLREVIAQQEGNATTLGLALVRDAEGPDALSKLSRYETTIERGFYRTLHELQRLQAARAGQAVAPPVAVDVNISPAE